MTRWEAFCFISDALRSMMARETPSIVAERISWDDVVQLASEHVVTPALAWALREARPIPDEIRDYLDVTLDLNRRRNETILDCLEPALAALNSAGCEPLLLKGGAALVDRLYPDLSVRYLTDLDILVPESRLLDASAALNKVDFHPVPDPTRRWARENLLASHHLPALFHERAGVSIELHRTVSLREFEPILSTAGVLERRDERKFRGLDLFVPCPTDRIIHNIVHSQLHHPGYKRGIVSLRQLFELALLALKFAEEIDWQQVENRFRTTGHLEVIQRHTVFLRHFFSIHLTMSGPDNPAILAYLQSSIETPSGDITALQIISEYFSNFLQSPSLALNFLNPFWWPARISSVRKRMRPDRTTLVGPE